jgi:hypothetical protein
MKPTMAVDPKIQAAQMNMGNSLAGLAANAAKPSMPTASAMTGQDSRLQQQLTSGAITPEQAQKYQADRANALKQRQMAMKPMQPNTGNPLAAMFGQGGKMNLQSLLGGMMGGMTPNMLQGKQDPSQAAAMANFFRNMFQKR